MKQLRRIPVVALLLVCFLCFAHPNAARAATVVNFSTFTAALAPGYFLETFAGQPTGSNQGTPILFTGGTGNAFSYNAVDRSAGGLTFLPTGGTAEELSTWGNGLTLAFDFLSANVTAIGGNFFLTDANGDPIAGSITVSLSDGTNIQIDNTSLSTFTGFLSPGLFITSLDIHVLPEFAGDYATVANFYVGALGTSGTVPEPATFGLLAAGLIAGGLLRKRFSLR